jgi:hypothetical protein
MEDKNWSVEYKDSEKGETWREMRRLANDRTKWKSFTSAL